MKIKTNYILAIVAAILLLLCWGSVYKPMHFDDVRRQRERAVKTRLLSIRRAEEAYRQRNGVYAETFGQLTASGLLADSMQYVPFSGGKPFDITTTVYSGKSGSAIPLMECGARYEDYLRGLDEAAVKEITEEADRRGLFPGLKIGDITTPNDNAGNWE